MQTLIPRLRDQDLGGSDKGDRTRTHLQLRALAGNSNDPSDAKVDLKDDNADDHLGDDSQGNVTTDTAESTDPSIRYPIQYDCSRGFETELLFQLVVEFDYEFVANASSTSWASSENINHTGVIDMLPQALPEMEWGLLWTVAYDLGLHGCKARSNTSNNATNIVEGGPSAFANLDSGGLIVSLSSRPIDTVDKTVSACEYLVTENDSIQNNAECYPMRGLLVARYVHEPFSMNTESVSATMISELQTIIQEHLDQQRSLAGNVLKTLYLGSRSEYALTHPQSNSIDKQPNSSSSTPTGSSSLSLSSSWVSIISCVGITFLAVLLALFFYFRGKKYQAMSPRKKTRAKNKAATPPFEMDRYLRDIEVDHIPHSHPSTLVRTDANNFANTTVSIDANHLASTPISISAKSIASSKTILFSNQRFWFGESSKVMELNDSDVPDALSLTSSESNEGSVESGGAVRTQPLTPPRSDKHLIINHEEEEAQTELALSPSQLSNCEVLNPAPLLRVPSTSDLPPLPPGTVSNALKSSPTPALTTASILNARRSRRKKKKKKKTLTARIRSYSFSRENGPNMETIAEVIGGDYGEEENEEEEDNGDDNDDDVSTYSWSTSDTEGSRSRDPSPARSISSTEPRLVRSHSSGSCESLSQSLLMSDYDSGECDFPADAIHPAARPCSSSPPPQKPPRSSSYSSPFALSKSKIVTRGYEL